MSARDWHGRWKAGDLAERFWSKTRPADNGCIEWTGGRNEFGYGHMSVKGDARFPCRMQLAHRVAWFLTTGRLPDGNLLHSCDNPPCVNPEHLRVGTHLENMRECVERGRHGGGGPAGVAHHAAKLTEAEVVEIRALRGVLTQRAVAQRYGVSRNTVGQIMRGQTWGSVP